MIKDPAQIEKIIQEVFASPKTVSVIINTRKHIEQLREAVENIMSTARHPENVEILVRADEDDDSTISQLYTLPSHVKVIIGKRDGYEGAHIGYWEMTQQAVGEFVLAYADDFMVTPNWDDYIQMHRGQVCVIFAQREMTFATHRSIPLVWRRFGICYHVDNHEKIIALELGVYVRHEEFIVKHEHRGTVRDYVENIDTAMWVNDKPIIYEMTDTLQPFVKRELFTEYTPITGPCNSRQHPINDWARGKIYWWPIQQPVWGAYWRIRGAREWFMPGVEWRDDWDGDEKHVAIPVPDSEKRVVQFGLPNKQKQKQQPPTGMPPSMG